MAVIGVPSNIFLFITCQPIQTNPSREHSFPREEPHLINTPHVLQTLRCITFFSFPFKYAKSHGTFFYVPNPNPKFSSFSTNHAKGETLLQLHPRPPLPRKLLRHDLSRCVFLWMALTPHFPCFHVTSLNVTSLRTNTGAELTAKFHVQGILNWEPQHRALRPVREPWHRALVRWRRRSRHLLGLGRATGSRPEPRPTPWSVPGSWSPTGCSLEVWSRESPSSITAIRSVFKSRWLVGLGSRVAPFAPGFTLWSLSVTRWRLCSLPTTVREDWFLLLIVM